MNKKVNRIKKQPQLGLDNFKEEMTDSIITNAACHFSWGKVSPEDASTLEGS